MVPPRRTSLENICSIFSLITTQKMKRTDVARSGVECRRRKLRQPKEDIAHSPNMSPFFKTAQVSSRRQMRRELNSAETPSFAILSTQNWNPWLLWPTINTKCIKAQAERKAGWKEWWEPPSQTFLNTAKEAFSRVLELYKLCVNVTSEKTPGSTQLRAASLVNHSRDSHFWILYAIFHIFSTINGVGNTHTAQASSSWLPTHLCHTRFFLS